MTLLLVSGVHSTLQAQFLQLTFSVENETVIYNESALDFGQIASVDSVQVNIGDTRKGIFSITGQRFEEIRIEMLPPTYLLHESYPDCITDDCRIEVRLRFNFSYAIESLVGDDTVLRFNSNQNQFLTVLNPIGYNGNGTVQLFVFVHGVAITRGALSGNYKGDLIINVEM